MAKRTFAVIGLGRFGAAMATTLSQLGHEVIGIDGSDDRVTALADQVSQTVRLDATDERALRASGIQDVDVAVVSIGENIVAKAVTPLHGRILEKLGVTRVVFPEREMAVRLAHSLVIPNVLDYIELSGDFSIVEVPSPAEFFGKTLREIGLRARFGLTTIAIKRANTRPGEVAMVSPGPDDVVHPGDVLALLGSNEKLGRIEEMLKPSKN